MAINFPNAPIEGQIFDSGNSRYTFTRGIWRGAPRGFARPFNYIINPAHQISQQNASNAGTASGWYATDQWVSHTSVVSFSGQRVARTTPNGSPFRYLTTITAAKPSYAVSEYLMSPYQGIESNRLLDFQWGTADAKQGLFRFQIYGKAGNYAVSFRNGASSRSCVVPFTVTADNVDQEITIVVPPDTGGTWTKDNSLGLAIAFCWGLGTTYATGTQNTWLSGNYIGLTTQSNGGAAANNSWSIGDLGFYCDPDKTGRAPPWQAQSDRETYLECQRYYQKDMGSIGVAIASTTTHQRASYPNQGQMRGVPTVILTGSMRAWDQATAPAISGVANLYSNKEYFEFNFTSASAQTAGRAAMLLDTSPSVYIAHVARI